MKEKFITIYLCNLYLTFKIRPQKANLNVQRKFQLDIYSK